MRRDAFSTTVLTLTAIFGVMTAAWAAVGPTGVLGVQDGSPRAVLRASAPGTLLSNSREGQPILVAQNMVPGESRTGDLTLANTSESDAAMALAARDVVDVPSSAPLSALLDLTVSDVTNAGAPLLVWSGKLRALTGQIPLGTFPVGAAHTYRFTATFPGGRSAALDNPYQGASTSLAFAWSATGVDPVPPPGGGGGGEQTGGHQSGGGGGDVIIDDVEKSSVPGYLKLRVYVRRTQAAHRQRVYVNVFCSHGCRLTATGLISLPSQQKKWKVKALKGSVTTAGTVKFRMALPKKALPVLNQALLHRRKASVTLKIAARSGTQTVNWTRTIHLAR